jgi:Sad1 / UNC-like C-terminal
VMPEPDQTPVLQQLQFELAETHDREKQAIRVMMHKRTELQNLVQGYITQRNADLATYQASLPAVVNLSTPMLWPTLENDACPDSTVDGGSVSVAEAVATIRERYRSQLAALMEASDVEGWIQQRLPRRTVDRKVVRLQQLITDRIEQDRADFDYTAKVIASTGNFVDQLPWVNRLMALWGLRFYGHDAAVAILPNSPRGASSSSTMGQCWALTPPATVTIQLSKSIYVQSVSIEHPSTAPKASAIHQFSVIAIDANLRSWALGSFVYNNEQGGRQDYMVRDEYQDEEIPPVRVIKLVVDTSWQGQGEDNVVTCLYRFRVFGEEDEKPIVTKLVHGKNWGGVDEG